MKFLKATAHNLRIHGHTVWLCARDPQLGWPLRIFALLIAGYALSPVDLIPDFLPIIGLLDDAILIPLAIWAFVRLAPDDIYARNRAVAETAAERPISRIGAACIIILWAALAAWFIWWLVPA
jgi:uncharacterized membrane protein YkvA (DUF1232 family)